MKLSDLKISTRLYLGFGAVVALLVVLVSMAYTNFSRLGHANDMNVHTYQVMGELDATLAALINIETGARGFALTGKDNSLEPYNGGKDEFQKRLDATRKLTADNPRQQERLQQLADAEKAWLDGAVDPTIKLRRAGGDADMAAVVAAEQAGKGKQGMDAMRKLVADSKNEESSLLGERSRTMTELGTSMSRTLIGGGLLAVALALVMSIMMARNITAPLAYAVGVAKRVAAGDLSARIDVRSKDETGQLMGALKRMNASLLDIVTHVRAGTDTIATASGEIAAGNQDLSSRTEQQASSLEETASSMEELTSTVKQNADNARQANQLAATASEIGLRGGEVVGPGGRHHGRDQRIGAQDRRHHRRHRRHRLPDQHPGAERRGGSGACRRAGPRLRRGRLRSAQPGPALGRRRQGNQGPDRRLGREGRSAVRAWSTRPARRWTKWSAASSA